MGRIGTVIAFRRTDEGGAKIAEVDVDLGGREEVTADVYGDAGADSPPVVGDYAAVIPGPQTGEWVATGFLDAVNGGVALGGERVSYGRDSNGAIVSVVTQEADGSVRIENDKGYVTLKADGTVDINGNFTVSA